MEDPNGSPAEQPNADQRIAELEAKLANVTKRYSDSSAEAQRLAQTIQQLQSFTRPQIPNRRPWEETLDSSGIPVDAIRQAIHDEASTLVQQQFEPLKRGIQARQTMIGRYKDYGKFESDIGELLSTDQDFAQMYGRVFEADPVAAFELAYYRLGESKKKSRSRPADDDLTESQIPSSRSGDTQRSPKGFEGDVEEAARQYRANPNPANARAFAKAKLKIAIPDEWLNQ